MKIRKLISIFIMLLFTTYSFTSGGIIKYIFPNAICIAVVFVLIATGVFYLSSFQFRFKNKILAIQIVLCITIILVNRNANFMNSVFVNDFAIITAFVFLLFSVQSNDWHKYFIIFSCIWTVIHAVITLMECFIPGLYMNYILPLFEGTAYYDILISGFNMGIMPGITMNPTSNGIYLSVGLTILSIICLTERKKKKSVFVLIVLIALTAFALLLTGKRALIIFSPLGIFTAYLIYNFDKPIKRVVIKIVSAILVILAIFFVSSKYVPELNIFINRFVETFVRGDVSAGRYQLYSVAFHLFKNNPLIGIGWDAYKYYYLSNYLVLKNTHNVYLQLLAENGVIGAIPFYTLFFVSYARAIREMIKYCRCKKSIRDHSIDLGLCFSVGMQTLFLLYSMTENPLYDAQMLFPYVCCVSIGEYYIAELKR